MRATNLEVIAVDLDDVLFDFIGHFFDWHNRVYGTHIRREDMIFETLWEAWDGTKTEAMERVPRFFNQPEHLQLEPIPGSVEVLDRLRHRYRLHIVSAREPEAADSTLAWIDKHFEGIFEGVNLGIANPTRPKPQTKAEVCQRLGATTLIDDQLIHIDECVRLGIRVLLYGNQVWNRTDQLPLLATRVADWQEVEHALSANE